MRRKWSIQDAVPKGRRASGGFIALPHSVLRHPNYISLSPRAIKLLLDDDDLPFRHEERTTLKVTDLNMFPIRKWEPASPMWPEDKSLLAMTLDGKQLWYSREPNLMDKLNRANWIRAGYSAKTFEKHRNEEAAAA